tara:strand:- start:45 stop:263 length:219 start_codon:yes stop_codon:yes gene_type:complete
MITAEIKEGKKLGTEFPKLMKKNGSNLIVRFQKPNSGVALVGDEGSPEGEYSNDWAMKYFVDFIGELKLKNN